MTKRKIAYSGLTFSGDEDAPDVAALYYRLTNGDGKLALVLPLTGEAEHPATTAAAYLAMQNYERLLRSKNLETKFVYCDSVRTAFETVKNFDLILQTDEEFWDCDCADGYIRAATYSGDGKCERCGAFEEEMPNARFDEIVRLHRINFNQTSAVKVWQKIARDRFFFGGFHSRTEAGQAIADYRRECLILTGNSAGDKRSRRRRGQSKRIFIDQPPGKKRAVREKTV